MENQMFTKKEMLAQGFTLTQLKSLVPAGTVKKEGRGRPAFTYSQAQVDQLKSAAVVAAVTVVPTVEAVETVEAEEVEAAAPVVAEEKVSEDLTDADFAAAA